QIPSKNASPLCLPATPPITQFCAVGGFWTSIESAVEFQITTLAPAQPCNDPLLSSPRLRTFRAPAPLLAAEGAAETVTLSKRMPVAQRWCGPVSSNDPSDVESRNTFGPGTIESVMQSCRPPRACASSTRVNCPPTKKESRRPPAIWETGSRLYACSTVTHFEVFPTLTAPKAKCVAEMSRTQAFCTATVLMNVQ